MNNSAFRSLVSQPSSTSPQNGGKSGSSAFQKPAALGSRARSSIPMTPRNVPGYNSRNEFARQVANQALADDGPPKKKFKSSSAPKGSRLASGYVDRAAAVRSGDGEGTDDKEKRLKALEEMMKLQQISLEEFEVMKSEMGVGGDTSSTHLVKGLDWKLLERVKRGEDVMNSRVESDDQENNEGIKAQAETEVDVEDELEKALERDVTATDSSKKTHDEVAQDDEHQESAQPASLSRDEILWRLKQSRTASKQSSSSVTGTTSSSMAPPTPAPSLNAKFKKIAAPPKSNKHKFTESINGRRREVLIVTQKDGSTKRKTRWLDPEPETNTKPKQADGQGEAWGMAVPAAIAEKARLEEEKRKEVEEDDDDIFQGVGADYDPLDGIESDSQSGEDDKPADHKKDESKVDHDESNVKNLSAPTMPTTASSERRNYFGSNAAEEEVASSSTPMARDPSILAALKRAAEIRRREEETPSSNPNPDATEKEQAFLAKLKERERQDAADMDLDYGFGGSRPDDDEGDDDGVILEDDEEGKKGKSAGRKRGPKKRKGDKNNFGDIMGVLEGREKDKNKKSK